MKKKKKNDSNAEKIEKIVNALNIKILPKEMKSKDTKALAQTIISKWLPLSFAALCLFFLFFFLFLFLFF